MRPGDEVVRLGGDEFVVLLSSVAVAEAETIANFVVRRFREPISLEGRVLHVSVSVGFAPGCAGMRAEDLIRNADCAMYAAKKQGKDQAQLFSVSVLDKAEDYLRIETELREAVILGGLVVYYQPIYSLSRNHLEGFEALSRWNHPERGLVSPAEFIPIAEETGIILALGRQMMREACRQMKLWNDRYGQQLTISVNVSARQFTDPELLPYIRSILEETGLSPTLAQTRDHRNRFAEWHGSSRPDTHGRPRARHRSVA